MHLGGLGFTYKWNMGWMHDMLDYIEGRIRSTASGTTTRSPSRCCMPTARSFVLPFSHDEVVHGKRSMLDKMPGDVWQKHANLRALYGYMFAHPGKKLMFMGGEIGQWREWNHDWQLDWEVLGDPRHAGLQRWVRDLNRVYHAGAVAVGRPTTTRRASRGSTATIPSTASSSLMREPRTRASGQTVAAVVNFTPVPRRDYRVGVPGPAATRAAQQRRRGLRRQQHRATQGAWSREAIAAHGHPQSLVAHRPTSGIPASETEQLMR